MESTIEKGKTDDELIAEFMGYCFDPGFNHLSNGKRGKKYSYYTNRRGNSLLPNRDKTFHNWNALMMVVKKIAKYTLQKECKSKKQFSQLIKHWNAIAIGLVKPDLKQTFKAVVDWIKWHNSLAQDK